MNPHRDTKFFRLLWGLQIMLKWKLFFWKLWHNTIVVTSNLCHQGIEVLEDCKICSTGLEECQQLFHLYPLVVETWRIGSLGILSQTTPHISFKDWLIA